MMMIMMTIMMSPYTDPAAGTELRRCPGPRWR